MVTSVVNALFDRLLEDFPRDRSYSANDLRERSMPGPVVDYLTHEMRRRLKEAAPPLTSESWIDVRDSGVRRARTAYLEALATHQRIPSEEWPGVLERACDETVRYIVRPSATLSSVIFADDDARIEPGVIFDALERFTAYPYFREVIEAYFAQKEISRVDRKRFEGLMNRIDRQMTIDYGSGEWIRLLRPLLSILSAAGYGEDVPIDILQSFLQEKGADAAAARLVKRYGSDDFVPTDELVQLFEGEAEESQNVSRRRTERMPTESREQERGSVPLWMQFEQGAAVAAEEPVSKPPGRSNGGSSEPLWKQFRKSSDAGSRPTDSGSSEDYPLADLEQSVLGSRGARNRDLFVRHLFAGNRREYESTLRKLQRVGSWSEASKVIAQDVFLKHQVNIYSDPAVAFTDAAESKYRS